MRKRELEAQIVYWQGQAQYWQGCYMTAQTTLNNAPPPESSAGLIEAVARLLNPAPVVVDAPMDMYGAAEPTIPKRTKLEQLEDWDWDGVLGAGMVPDGFVEAMNRETEEG